MLNSLLTKRYHFVALLMLYLLLLGSFQVCYPSLIVLIVYYTAFSERWFDSELFSCRFIVGGESLEGQLVNSREPKVAIYLYTHVFMRVLSSQASQRCKPLIRAFHASPP